MRLAANLYYTVRPLLPRRLQIELRRGRAAMLRRRHASHWPVDDARRPAPPPDWPGWPGGKRFALVLTHDVETGAGVERSMRVAAMERERDVRSAFAFVPNRYHTPEALREELREGGFEVLVHGLHHDGKLFTSHETFLQRAERINEVLAAWRARGFAAPAAHHHFGWMGALDIDYDISSFDDDPFEPQGCGLDRIFPFWVAAPGHPRGGFVELPYTLAQDFTAFVMLREAGIEPWTRKLEWIARAGGMALLKTHPDYMSFSATDGSPERYPAERYAAFLDHVRDAYGDDVWIALPSEVAAHWRDVSARRGRSPATRAQASLPVAPTFCPTCRRAHAAGALLEYATTDASRAPRLAGSPEGRRGSRPRFGRLPLPSPLERHSAAERSPERGT